MNTTKRFVDSVVVFAPEGEPEWMGGAEPDWRWRVRSFYYPTNRYFSAKYRHNDACLLYHATEIDGQAHFQTWCARTEHMLNHNIVHGFEEWDYLRDGYYGRWSFLRDLPTEVHPCRKCTAMRAWETSMERLGMQERDNLPIETVEQFRQMPDINRTNRYIESLRHIYFCHYGFPGHKATLKTLARSRAGRRRTSAIVEELLALGIVTLEPTGGEMVYINYNETVDIGVALEVLSWHGKSR